MYFFNVLFLDEPWNNPPNKDTNAPASATWVPVVKTCLLNEDKVLYKNFPFKWSFIAYDTTDVVNPVDKATILYVYINQKILSLELFIN